MEQYGSNRESIRVDRRVQRVALRHILPRLDYRKLDSERPYLRIPPLRLGSPRASRKSSRHNGRRYRQSLIRGRRASVATAGSRIRGRLLVRAVWNFLLPPQALEEFPTELSGRCASLASAANSAFISDEMRTLTRSPWSLGFDRPDLIGVVVISKMFDVSQTQRMSLL